MRAMLVEGGSLDREDVHEAREVLDAMLGSLPPAEGMATEQVEVAGRPTVWVRPPGVETDHCVLYLHGGAFGSGRPRPTPRSRPTSRRRSARRSSCSTTGSPPSTRSRQDHLSDAAVRTRCSSSWATALHPATWRSWATRPAAASCCRRCWRCTARGKPNPPRRSVCRPGPT